MARIKNNSLDRGKTSNRTQLKQGNLYEGTVIDVSMSSKSCIVNTDRFGIQIPGCIVASSVMASLLGFKTSFLPTPNTRVVLLYGTPPVIVACLPSDAGDGTNADTSTTTGAATAVTDLQTFAGTDIDDHSAHTWPNDMLEGEFEIANSLGVALTMLTTLSKLSAGSQAQVSVHLLNDMVRIISRTFRHFSAFGDCQIFNDGRLQARWDGTSYEHEALGRMDSRDPKITVNGGVVDFSNINAVTETGRWRFSQFLGFLGDFVHIFVTDPVDAIGALAADAYRSGKANLHVGNGGEILFQTVSEIALERVVRIVVPIEVKRHEDPQGTLQGDYDNLEASFLKIWDFGENNKTIAHTAYQLREYARWLSEYHSLARFHQVHAKGGDYNVPSEVDTPAPEWTSHETDKEQANPNITKYKDCYATIRIMRDGSIVAMEAGGAAISMVNGCTQVAAPKHLWFEAGGNIYMRAGQNVFITARRSVELAAIAGGVIIKARTWLRALCEWGSVYIKSDAGDPADPDYVAKTQDDCTWGDQDPLPVVLEQAVLIEATKGRSQVIGHTRAILSANGNPTDDNDDTGNAEMHSKFNRVRIAATKDADVFARRHVRLKAGQDLLVGASRALWDLVSGIFDINKSFSFNGYTLSVAAVKANITSAIFAILGPKQPRPGAGGRPHENHIISLPDDNTSYLPKFATDDDIKLATDLQALQYSVPADFAQPRPVWDFELPDATTIPDEIFQSLAQQRVVHDATLSSDYSTWTWSSQNILQNPGTNGRNLPALAAPNQQLEHAGGDDLTTPTSKSGSALTTQTPLTKHPITVQFLKT